MPTIADLHAGDAPMVQLMTSACPSITRLGCNRPVLITVLYCEGTYMPLGS